MTKREAAIVSAYTGIFIGDFSDLHEYIEEIMKRPVYTHELANENIRDEIKNRSKQDYINIIVE